MTQEDIKKHLLAFAYGLAATMCTSALIAGMQFLGSHIPDAINLVSGFTVASVTARIKLG